MTDSPSTLVVPPFFIVANDRSGTTMLRLILDRSADVAVPTESMIVSDFASVRADAPRLADHAEAAAFARTVWEHPKVRLWEPQGDAPVPPPGLSHDEAYRFAIEAPYRAYAARYGKPSWGDKTPSYIEHIDEILAVWPEARIVNIVRDGRDVAMSIRRMPFGSNNTWAGGSEWARGVRLAREAARRHPSRVYTLRYEDLVAAPEAQVRPLCEWLGISFDRSMLQIEETSGDKVVAGQEAWFAKVWAGISQTSVGKWRRSMSDRQIRVFAAVAGRELHSHGYDTGIDEHGMVCREPGGSSDAALPEGVRPPASTGYWFANAAMRGVNFARLRLVQERGRELRYVMQRKLQRT